MLGAIIGDIVGSIYEHHNIKTKDFVFFNSDCRMTDDSVMSLAIANALLKSSNENEFEDNVVKNMQEFGRRYPNAGYGRRFISWIYSDTPRPYHSFGNGSAMRVSPVSWVANSVEQAEHLAEVQARTTHDHPDAILGAKAVAAAIYMARTGSDKDEIREYLQNKYYTLSFTLDDIRDEYIFDVSCSGSVPEAIEAFLESSSFEDAIRNAVSIGGDSDTIAAITGSIAEAFYGVPSWIEDEALGRMDDYLFNIYLQFRLYCLNKS